MTLEEKLKKGEYDFLGWANSWGLSKQAPERVRRCRHELHHVTIDREGYENIAYCSVCRFYYKYDSSD